LIQTSANIAGHYQIILQQI